MVQIIFGLLLAVLEASVGEEETLAFKHLLPLVNSRTCNIIDWHIYRPSFRLSLTYLTSRSLRSDKLLQVH